MTLFDLADRQIADTSLAAYEAILPTLKRREFDVLLLMFAYLEATGYVNVTGGELAEWSGRDKTSLRPRLHDLHAEGLLTRWPARASRAGELQCAPYAPAVPKAAILRAREQIRSSA